MNTRESIDARNTLIKAKVTKATVCVLSALPQQYVSWQNVAMFFGVTIPTLNNFNTGKSIPMDGLAKMLQVLGELDDWVQNIHNIVSNATERKTRALPMVKPVNLSSIEERIAPVIERIASFDPDRPETHWLQSKEAVLERQEAISAIGTCLHHFIKHEKLGMAQFSELLPLEKKPSIPTMQRITRGNHMVSAHKVIASLHAIQIVLIQKAAA